LEDDVSYFIDPEDGVPKKVITQRSTKYRTIVGGARFDDLTERETIRDTAKFLVAEDFALVVRAIRDRWSSDKDPPLPEDPQQLVSRTEVSSTDSFNITWDRTRMKNKSALAMQLVYWIYGGIPPELIAPQAANDEEEGSVSTAATTSSKLEIKTWGELWRYHKKKLGWLTLRYLIGTIVLTVMVRSPLQPLP
jgi:hypothetical protein